MMTAGVRDLLGNLDGVLLEDSGVSEIDGLRPGVAARPRDTEALCRLLQAAHGHRLRLVARGGGTMLHIGNTPAGVDAVLDLSALRGVTEYRPRDLTITVAAGTPWISATGVLAAEGQMLGLDPPLPARASAGGALATNAAGPRRFRYGTARDYVIGISAALAEGAAIKSGGRVVKNVAGYDFAKLLIGSWGTLAIITSVTFRVYPRPAETGAVVAGFAALEEAHRAALAVAGSTLLPLSLELVSPGVLRGTTGGEDGWLLVSEAAGSPATVRRTRDELMHLCRAHGARAVSHQDAEAARALLQQVRDFGYGDGIGALTVRAAMRPSRVAEGWRQIVQVAETRGLAARGVARAGNGALLCALEGECADEPELVGALRAAVQPLGAAITVERCRPETKAAIDVWGTEGNDLAIMRRVKEQYDPAGVLGPGRGPAGG